MAFNPDGKILATAGEDKMVRLWDVESGKPQQISLSHRGRVLGVAFSPDGTSLASVGDDLGAKIWDGSSGVIKKTLAGTRGQIDNVALSSSRKLLVASSDNIAIIWDVTSGNQLSDLVGHEDRINSVAFNPEATLVATSSQDGTVKIWDVATGKDLQTLKGHRGAVYAVAFNPKNRTQLATGGYDDTAKVWDVSNGTELLTLRGHGDTIWSITFGPDGTTLATGSEDNTVKLWDISSGKDGKEIVTLLGHTGTVRSVAFTTDGRKLATASDDKTVKLWDVKSRKELTSLALQRFPVSGVVFSPDGKKLVTISDRTARYWDVDSGESLLTFSGHSAPVIGAVFASNRSLTTVSKAATFHEYPLRDADLIELAAKRPSRAFTIEECKEYRIGINQCEATALVAKGRDLVRAGRDREAVESFKKAQKLDPFLRLDPETEVMRIKAESLFLQAGMYLVERNIKEAVAAFDKIYSLNPKLISADDWNYLCWTGSVRGNAAVVMNACEKAVALAQKNDIAEIRDSRGLARALTDNIKGAIEDFQAYVNANPDSAGGKQRQGWIDALRAGQNPFTPEVLKSLDN